MLTKAQLDSWIQANGPYLYHAVSPSSWSTDRDLERAEKIAQEGIHTSCSAGMSGESSHAYMGTAAYTHGCSWWNAGTGLGDFPAAIRIDLRELDPSCIDIDPDHSDHVHSYAADGFFYTGPIGGQNDPANSEHWHTKEQLYLRASSPADAVLASLAKGSCSHRGMVPAGAIDINPEYLAWVEIARARGEYSYCWPG